MKKTFNLSRRQALVKSALGFGSLHMQSLVTGLPIAFLAGSPQHAWANTNEMKYTILSHLHDGDPNNVNVPGTYADNSSDPRSQIERAKVSEFSAKAEGFEVPETFNLGNQTVKGAAPWASLPDDLRSNLAFWHHSTRTNAHADHQNVLRFHGSIKDPMGNGSAQLAEAIAQETSTALGTALKEPLSVGGTPISFKGRPIPVLNPMDIKELFSASIAGIEQMASLRDKFIDRSYKSLKNEGTPAQKAFLERYAISRQEAQVIAGNLGELIEDIDGNSPLNQAKMAVALIQTGIAPVVTLGMTFGGDNHGDSVLKNEVEETTEVMAALATLWSKLKAANIQDKVVFSSLNVFGRTFLRNSNDGRNHNGDHHCMFTFGSSIKPGVVGGIEPVYKSGSLVDFSATGINAANGKTDNADIPYEQTLVSVGKTLARSVGISEERINVRFNGGKIINGALIS